MVMKNEIHSNDINIVNLYTNLEKHLETFHKTLILVLAATLDVSVLDEEGVVRWHNPGCHIYPLPGT